MSEDLERILLDERAIRERVLPRARAVLNVKLKDLIAAEWKAKEMLAAPAAAVQEWENKVAALVTLAGNPDDPSVDQEAPAVPEAHGEDGQAGSMQVLVIEVLEREPRKLRSRDVRDLLLAEGHDVTADSVSNALYYAATQAKKIRKLNERGWYAPLSYTEAFEPANGRLTISDPDSV